MAKLIVNPTSPQRQELVLGRTLISIGRDPSNDLVLADAMVSRRHAVIELRGGQYYLRDCNSSNGSLVNGDRVNERGLRDGDLVAVGTARLLFREDVATLDPAGKVVQHPSAPRLRCGQCGADHRRGDVFCKQCGATLVSAGQPRAVCSACGTAVPLPARFCNACGGRLGSEDGSSSDATGKPSAAASDAAPASEGAVAPPPSLPSLPEAAPAAADVAALAAEAPAALDISASALESLPEPPRETPAPLRVAPQPEAPPAASRAPARDRTAPPARPPRPLSVIVGGAAPAAAADRSWAPKPWTRPAPQRHAPGRGAASPVRGSEPADLGSRLLAGVLDFGVVAVAQGALLAPAAQYWWARDLAGRPPLAPIVLTLGLGLVTIALGALYFIYFWGVRGATPGKRILGLSVEDSAGGYPIGIPRAAARLLGYLLSAALLGGGFLLIPLDGNGLHDRLAGTRVVRRRT